MKRFTFAAGLVLALLLAACSGGSKRAPTPAATASVSTVTATPTATSTPIGTLPQVTRTIPSCAVDREICDFALQAETWVRNGDSRALIAPGTPCDNPNDLGIVKASIEGSLPVVTRPAHLASIGCPLVNGAGNCSEAFSLTFSTLLPNNERSDRGVLTLGFGRRPGATPAFSSVGTPQDDARWFATEWGGTSATCNLSGAIPKTETECIRTVFNIVTVERTPPAA